MNKLKPYLVTAAVVIVVMAVVFRTKLRMYVIGS